MFHFRNPKLFRSQLNVFQPVGFIPTMLAMSIEANMQSMYLKNVCMLTLYLGNMTHVSCRQKYTNAHITAAGPCIVNSCIFILIPSPPHAPKLLILWDRFIFGKSIHIDLFSSAKNNPFLGLLGIKAFRCSKCFFFVFSYLHASIPFYLYTQIREFLLVYL